MPWYAYLACFFAAISLTDGVPHFVKGICGEAFPAAFAKSPDKEFSSPVANVLEGILDFIVGGILFHIGRLSTTRPATIIAFVAGAALTSVLLSHRFGKLHR